MTTAQETPGPPPKSLCREVERLLPAGTSGSASPPESSAIQRWQETRDANLASVTEVVTPDKVREVMNALHQRAIGINYTDTKVNKEGQPVTVEKYIPPNVNAARLYLAYAIGQPQNLFGGEGKQKAPEVTEDAFKALAEVAMRFGADLRFVKRPEAIDAEYVVKDEEEPCPQLPQGKTAPNPES